MIDKLFNFFTLVCVACIAIVLSICTIKFIISVFTGA